MKVKILSFLYDEHGATAIEYALLASLIAVAIIVAVTAVGLATLNLFEDAANQFPTVP